MKAMVGVALGGILVSMILGYIVYGVLLLLVKPYRIRRKLESQGVRGPPLSSFFLGNIPQIQQIKLQTQYSKPSNGDPLVSQLSHDWTSLLFPHLKLWQHQYGPVFIYATGSMQILCILDPHIVKEIISCSTLDLGKPSYLSKDHGPLLGEGVISSSGSIWAHQRKIIAPEFYPDKVKAMMGLMAETTISMLDSWEERIDNSGGTAEITIDEDLTSMTADIISKTAFGSSHSLGKQICSKIRTLQKQVAKTLVGIPGSRYAPTEHNREMRRLQNDINAMIARVVKERTGAEDEKNFLQKILESARSSGDQETHTLKIDLDKFIVDNCKSIYFAGHETTALTTAWVLMLLAAYPDWQARARAEVLQVCGGGIPVADDLRNMKVMTMIIQETLRLYTPAAFVSRTALEVAKLNDFRVPKGTCIQIPVALLHHNPDLWGPDVHSFNPERFANGTAEACKVPQAYAPFGFGARICLGQHMAMIEVKVILSLILSKFSFSLSPAYQHSPAFRLVIVPEHGIKLLVTRA